jgi:glycosyltransferase involved in cell wall biosynthesis
MPSETGDLTVLHVVEKFGRAGIARQMTGTILHASDPAAHHVAILFDEDRQETKLPNEPVVVGFPDEPRRGFIRGIRVARNLRKLIRELRPDVVHAYNARASFLTTLATPRGIPIVVSRHESNLNPVAPVVPGMYRWFRWVERPCYRRVSCVIAVSRALAATLPSSGRYPPVRVIHDAIDLEHFAPVPLPDPAVPPTATKVARLHPVKRHDLFLRAIGLLRDRGLDIRAILVGDGPERSRLEALVTELDLTERVRFTGEVEDVRPFMGQAHVVAQTSAFEGFGDVVIEAMAMGRPVVGTARGGMTETIRDGQDGFLVDVDETEIADALERVLTDRALLERLAGSASERGAEFGWPRKVQEQEAVYREALEGATRRRRSRTKARADGAPPRVVHVVYAASGGGRAKMVSLLSEEAARRGWDVRVIYRSGQPPTERAVTYEELRSGGRVWQWPWALRSRLRHLHPDLVVLHGPTVGSLGSVAARVADVPSVLYVEHGIHRRRRRYHRTFRRLTARFPSRNVAVSRASAESMIHDGHVPAGRVSVIANGVPRADRLSAPRGELRRFVYVAHLWTRKAHGLLLQAFASTPETFELVLVGEGRLREELERTRDSLGLADRVRFTGFLDDPWSAADGAWAYVHPPDEEASGLAIMEAMMRGLPVVATATGGMVEFVQEGVNGMLVPVGDVDGLRTAITTLGHDRELRDRLAAGAFAHAHAELTAERCLGEHLALHARLLGIRETADG